MTVVAARSADDVIVVLDASNSMWGQIDGTAKIEIARNGMDNLLLDWDPETNLGLVVYGHRREADCSDIETVIPPGPLDADAFMRRIGEISPLGRTPLTAAVEHAAEELSYRDNPGTVILISDGVESCQRDPCALASSLAEDGVGFTIHVIGFGLADEERDGLDCIAEETGGLFVTAQNADDLMDALIQVRTAIAQAALEEIEIIVPPTAVVGSTFQVLWSNTIDGRDFIAIVPLGADQGALGNWIRASVAMPADLQAPSAPGLYEVRYVLNEDRRTLAVAQIEIVEAEVTITAPPTAVAGARIEVSWSNTIDGRDFITIVPLGANQGTQGDSVRANAEMPAVLQAPAAPGLYEVRYVLNEGRRTIAAAKIEIVQPAVSVTAPPVAVAGMTFEVSWAPALGDRDFITIVLVGAAEGELGPSSVRTRVDSPARLLAVRRQRPWDRLGGLNKRGFLAHLNPRGIEDETEHQSPESIGREGREGHPAGDSSAVRRRREDPDRSGGPARRGQYR